MHTREFEIVSRGKSRCKIPAIWAGFAVFGLASLTQIAEYPRFFEKSVSSLAGSAFGYPPSPRVCVSPANDEISEGRLISNAICFHKILSLNLYCARAKAINLHHAQLYI